MSPELENVLAQADGTGRDNLIPLLQKVQELEGYVSRQAVVGIARRLQIPPSKVYGVATFYNQFRFQPRGKYHILVCRGTACHVKGSAKVLETLQRLLKVDVGNTASDGLFSLEQVACIGACGLAPVIAVNGEFHANVTPEKLGKILAAYRRREQVSEEVSS